MKIMIIPLVILLCIGAAPCMAENVPLRIGPFVLGQDIKEFAAYVDMSSELPIRYLENVKEVKSRPIVGFKSGLIAYGGCDTPGQIIRIKLKYTDDSRAFFNTLRKRIEDRFGKFEEYRGDPFQVALGWKKSFKDSQGNSLSLIIQHNLRDEESKMGNSIKLTMTNLWDAAGICHQENTSQKTPQDPIKIPVKDLWDLFIPQ